MKKEWFSAQELLGISGLPCSPQGINRRARIEKWLKRPRRGKQGRSIEYHISCLPNHVVSLITLREDSGIYSIDPLTLLVEALKTLSEHERQILSNFIVREGVQKLITIIDLSMLEKK